MSQDSYQHACAGERMPEASPLAQALGSGSTADPPRSVTRGETQPDATPNIAHVDWLAFSVCPPVSVPPITWMARALETLFGIQSEGWRSSRSGWQGYTHRVDLGDFGILAYGGERQRGTIHVSLNAKACAAVRDWYAVRVWGETYEARICRVDLAHDDFESETFSVDRALELYRLGAFALNGRPAGGHLRDDLGSGDGRTLYVGKRVNGKLCRVYEKGKQLGDPTSPWCRVEVELRNKSRVIPWDALTRPAAYLAGAYPCLAVLSSQQSKIKTVQRTFDMTYAQMREWLRTAAGRALYAMCEVEGGDAGAVLAQVVREGHPKRLKGIPKPSDPLE